MASGMALSYAASIEFLYGLQKHGIKLGLETIQALLAALKHPQSRYAVFHIGGTNGKGSTAAMAAAILQAMGYRVGLYTSPHLVDFRERIRVQGQFIPRERVSEFIQKITGILPSHLSPTFFEFTTGMAFQYFADEHVDIAVIEVGMGGRFDATNVCSSLGTMITNVAFDHEAYLGRTLQAIAFEKAGIIKRGVPVVVGPMPDEAKEVVMRRAREQEAPCYWFDSDFHIASRSPARFGYSGVMHSYENLSCALAGDHQVTNAGCALALLEVGAMTRLEISEEAIRAGLSSVAWEGRLEMISQDPILLLDGAHNPASAEVLAPYLLEQASKQDGRKIILVIGMMRDKDMAGFLEPLAPLSHTIIFTQIEHPRAASVQDLHNSLPMRKKMVHLAPSPSEAVSLALQLATPDDLICVTGSLFLVGHVKSFLRECELPLLLG